MSNTPTAPGVYVQLDARLTPDLFPDASEATHDHDGYLRLSDTHGDTVAVVAPREWQWYRIVRQSEPTQPSTLAAVLTPWAATAVAA